jgi:hypothetical protein
MSDCVEVLVCAGVDIDGYGMARCKTLYSNTSAQNRCVSKSHSLNFFQ